MYCTDSPVLLPYLSFLDTLSEEANTIERSVFFAFSILLLCNIKAVSNKEITSDHMAACKYPAHTLEHNICGLSLSGASSCIAVAHCELGSSMGSPAKPHASQCCTVAIGLLQQSLLNDNRKPTCLSADTY